MRNRPTLRPLLLALAALASLAACSSNPPPAPLSPAERALISDLVAVYRLQVLDRADPERAERLRERLSTELDPDELSRRVEALGQDPVRGAQLLRAVRDSLQSARGDLFASNQGIEEPEGEAPDPEEVALPPSVSGVGDRRP